MCLSVVQEYSSEIREAPLVTFAVAVALAFEANNFVKFFKFLRCVVDSWHVSPVCYTAPCRRDFVVCMCQVLQTICCMLNTCVWHVSYICVVGVHACHLHVVETLLCARDNVSHML